MRLQLWNRLVAAAVGAIVLTGSASAQQPAAARPAGNQIVVAQPAPGPTAPSVPAVQVAPGTVVGDGGCATGPAVARPAHPAATAARGFVMQSSGGYYGTDCQTGRTCNNGCGSLRSDLGFALGNCRSFFDPCGSRPLSCGWWGCGRCLTPVYGTGSAWGPMNPCVYDSYLNH